MDFIIDSGYSKPISSLNVDTIEELIQPSKCHYIIYRAKATLHQLMSSLNILNVSEALSTYPEMFKSFFVHTSETLTAGKL